MKSYYEERTMKFAKYIIEKKATIRDTAKRYGISKSTVHKDINIRLQDISPSVYQKVREVLDQNKAERHMRGGIATKNKYMNLRKQHNIQTERSS